MIKQELIILDYVSTKAVYFINFTNILCSKKKKKKKKREIRKVVV